MFALFSFGNSYVHAQTQSLSVTPPLIQLSLERGGVWQSSVKVVNPNPYELTVYAEVVDFEAAGELGQGRFIPIIESDPEAPSSLARWITLNRGPYLIPREQTVDVPFLVEVPEDAPPGGHFAAILVSTSEPSSGGGPFALKTSQAVTALFFVRIEGDVIEQGIIREFRSLERFYDVPTVDLTLRFENKGNVHLQPKGSIVIKNMWGSERGIIPVNQRTHFGNVLPKSIRDFKFSWSGDPAFTEIGRYTASVILAFGENGSQSVVGETTFWVLPFKATFITLGVILVIGSLIVLMIRLYVRHMLRLAGVDVSREQEAQFSSQAHLRPRRRSAYRTVTAPLSIGARDFRTRLSGVRAGFEVITALFGFISQYRVFFASVLLLIGAFIALVLYVGSATIPARPYEVTITDTDSKQVLDAEEVLYTQDRDLPPLSEQEQDFNLVLLNGSGVVGASTPFALLFEERGYVVSALDTEPTVVTQTTVRAPAELISTAEELVRVLRAGGGDGFDVEIVEETDESAPITITVTIGANALNL